MKISNLLVIALLVETIYAEYNINDYCRKIGEMAGGSYQIEQTCREMEENAKNKLFTMYIPPRVDSYCEKIGKIAGGSYQLKLTCVEQELKSKKSLGY